MRKQKAHTTGPATIGSSLIEIIVDEILKWAKTEIHADVPIALTSLRNGLINAISTFLNANPESDFPINSMDSYLEGRKGGEMSKELAMIAGMVEIGLNKEQIDQVVECSKHAWDSIKKEGRPLTLGLLPLFIAFV